VQFMAQVKLRKDVFRSGAPVIVPARTRNCMLLSRNPAQVYVVGLRV
jgi:hypothetical protein